jgi:Fibronectin type III domain
MKCSHIAHRSLAVTPDTGCMINRSRLSSRLLSPRLFSVGFVALATFGATLHATSPASAQAATTTVAPAAPTLPGGFLTTSVQFLTATRKGDRDVQINWIPPQTALSPIVRYRVSAGTDTAAALPNPAQYVVNAGVTTVTFRNLMVGHTFFFQVQPETSTGAGAPSELTAPIAITDGSERKPFPPTGLNVSVLSSTQANVAWVVAPPRANVTISKYRVTTFPSTRTVDVPAQITSVVLTTLKPGVTYYIQVQTVSSENKFSDPALSAPITTPAIVTTPTVAPTIATTIPATTTSTTTTTILLPLPSPVEVPALKPAARCTSRVWSPTLLGVPSRLQAGAPAGVYIWTDGRAIHMRTYNNTNTPVRFSGTVSANTTMSTARFYLEADADSVSIGRSAASFSFSSAYDIDALRFDGRCVRSVTFRLSLNGQPIPPSQIFLGANNVNPTTSAFVLNR